MYPVTKRLNQLFEEMDLTRGFFFDSRKQTFLIPRHDNQRRFIVAVQATDGGDVLHFQSAFDVDPPVPVPPNLWVVAGRMAADHTIGRLVFSEEDRAIVSHAVLEILDGELGPLQLRRFLDAFTEMTAASFRVLRLEMCT